MGDAPRGGGKYPPWDDDDAVPTRVAEELKLPVVALNPDNEPTDTASMKKYGVDVVIMPGVGHFLMMEDPMQFNRLLKTIVQKLDK